MHTSRTSSPKTVVAALAVLLAGAAPGWCLEPKVVTFATEDGVEIVADYYAPTGPAAAPVVILLHMYRSDRAAWKPLMPALHEAGFAVLAIDMRGHGDSIKPETQNLRRRMRPGLEAVQRHAPRRVRGLWYSVAATELRSVPLCAGWGQRGVQCGLGRCASGSLGGRRRVHVAW